MSHPRSRLALIALTFIATFALTALPVVAAPMTSDEQVVDQPLADPTISGFYWEYQPRCSPWPSACASFNPRYYIPVCFHSSIGGWNSPMALAIRLGYAEWNDEHRQLQFYTTTLPCDTLDVEGFNFVENKVGDTADNTAATFEQTASCSVPNIGCLLELRGRQVLRWDNDWNFFYGNEGRGITEQEVDVESIAVHEFGHAARLGHSHHNTDVMSQFICGTSGGNATLFGCVRHNLGTYDDDGIRASYAALP